MGEKKSRTEVTGLIMGEYDSENTVIHYWGGGGEKFLPVGVNERGIWKYYNGNIVCGFRGHVYRQRSNYKSGKRSFCGVVVGNEYFQWEGETPGEISDNIHQPGQIRSSVGEEHILRCCQVRRQGHG